MLHNINSANNKPECFRERLGDYWLENLLFGFTQSKWPESFSMWWVGAQTKFECFGPRQVSH